MPGQPTIKKTTCGMCPSGCGIEVHVADGKVLKVCGDAQSPLGGGSLCVKAAASLDLHRHPDRLNYPLKRIGKRGEDRWQRISWTDALDEIAGKLADIRERHGPEALVYFGGTTHSPGDWSGWRFCNLFGSPNIFGQGKNCGEAEFLAECAMYGNDTITSPIVPGKTKCAILWGNNPIESAHLRWASLGELRKAGTILIVVDPRYTETAAKSDLWLQLRPATDGALALGMLNVIIEEDLYDKAFVEEWCIGFEQIKECVRDYPPSKVAAITNVPEEKIAQAARLYANNSPAVITFGVATCHQGSGATKSAVLAKSVLRAITGNIDLPGGQYLREGLTDLKWPENLHWDEMVDHPLRTRDNVSAQAFPIASVKSYSLYREAMKKLYPAGYVASQYMLWVAPTLVWKAITEGKPYPVRAIITQGGNPLVTTAGGRKIYDALTDDKLELHVGMDLFMNPTIQLADYVLPAADFLERPAGPVAWGLSEIWTIGEKAVEPSYERREDYQFWRELGLRLGQAEHWPESFEGLVDQFLEPVGQSYRQLVMNRDLYHRGRRKWQKYKTEGFATFSGKVELVPSIFERLGYEPLPRYEEAPQSPRRSTTLAEGYPLVLISGSRLRWYTHSTLRQIPRLRRKHPEPILQIHPETAVSLGILDGDWVFLETTVGRIKQKAKLTTIVAPDVVHADGYWWFPEKPASELFGLWESSVNSIIPDAPEVCDYAGDQFFRGPLCKVYKAI